jgi:hypothetical protein
VTKQDCRDWFIMGALTAFGSSIIVYVFKYPDPVSFTAACGALPLMLGLYHWFVVRDDKFPDANP